MARAGKAAKSSVISMSIGVGLATGLYGISFGALSTAAGLTLWQTQAVSYTHLTLPTKA